MTYYRLHGSPRIYYSAYKPVTLDAIAVRLAVAKRDAMPTWCIFDNTADFAATGDALATVDRLRRHNGGHVTGPPAVGSNLTQPSPRTRRNSDV
ncbi:DUF72 domain-containing protein [Methylobacterium durans]|uniref:DUF72 domain-containing protein n=1 Tax=Methylobacterium durans TaxID=2202825 RepID=UPI001F2F970C|nr:DUF72 domain-containing protein [Methylobacterium durans]